MSWTWMPHDKYIKNLKKLLLLVRIWYYLVDQWKDCLNNLIF